MNQCGPLWHRLQFHNINVVSDLIILNACSHFPGFAIACLNDISRQFMRHMVAMVVRMVGWIWKLA